MKKTVASMMFLTLLIVALTTFAVAAGTQLSPGANVPAKAGLSSPGQFRQGMQTGTFGQGAAGGVAGGIQNVPGSPNKGQPQGQGIAIGEPAPSGGSQCYCIRAPCNCPGSSQGGTLPFPNLPQNQPDLNQPFQGQLPQGQQVLSQPFQGQLPQGQQVLSQPFQGQPLSTLPASAGTGGNVAFANAAGTRAGTL